MADPTILTNQQTVERNSLCIVKMPYGYCSSQKIKN